MVQILLGYGLPKETVAAIMMLYRSTKKKFAHPMETDFFGIVASELQGVWFGLFGFMSYQPL